MPDPALARKLLLKPGMRAVLINPPAGYEERLWPIDGVEQGTPGEPGHAFVQAFVTSKSEVDRFGTAALDSVARGGLLWMTYPKKPGKNADLNRDRGWDAIKSAGYTPVSLVSVDETWSALRFRPNEDVGR